ncbi:MAG TPA: hypothetical protein VIH14_03925 [Anaerolineales bacterium]
MLIRQLLAVALGLLGLVFFAQGTGLFTPTSSFMNNQAIWAVIGIGLVILSLLLWPRN